MTLSQSLFAETPATVLDSVSDVVVYKICAIALIILLVTMLIYIKSAP